MLSSTDCFVVSQFFGVAWHVGRLKLGSRPTQLYVRLSIIPLRQQVYHLFVAASHQTRLDTRSYHVSQEIIMYEEAAFVCLHYTLPDTRVLNSFEELCIMWAAGVNSSARVLNPHWRAYILSSTDRLFCLY